jgi:DNA-directed RNA polymerase subunit RPC12/RpoP
MSDSLPVSHPELAAEWHPTKNGAQRPEDFTFGSGRKFWWLASCGHEWESAPNQRTSGYSCPYCSSRLVLSGTNDLATRYPEIALEWHPSRNGDLRAESVPPFSNKSVWWLGACGHEWTSTVAARIKAIGCPYCSNKRVLEGFNDLATVRPDLAAEWHPTKNGTLLPSAVALGSSKRIHWLGPCGHQWAQTVNDRKNGAGCPFCKGKAVLKGFNDLATVRPDLAAEWHPTKNGERIPESQSAGQKVLVWWLGSCGHEWKASINNRSDGSGCPSCSPGGFKTSNSGILYFIHSPALGSFKIGITSGKSKNLRLKKFSSRGWKICQTWEHSSGRVILNVETKFLKWLRHDLKIPHYLDQLAIGDLRGETETFSDSIISSHEVIAELQKIFDSESGKVE